MTPILNVFVWMCVLNATFTRAFDRNGRSGLTLLTRHSKGPLTHLKIGGRNQNDHRKIVSAVKLSPNSNQAKEEERKESSESLKNSYIILAVLLFGFASNQWSRQALFYLCDFSENGNALRHINVALNFDKEMYAALASFGFTIVFAIVSLFSGGIADKNDRNIVAGLSCLAWSLSTALQANARSFADLVPLRVFVGASQAFYNPAAYTLLADQFPKRMLGTVNGIFSSGVYVGGALASLSILLDNSIGWRSTMLVIGVVGGFASFLLVSTIREPRLSKGGNIQISGVSDPEIPMKSAIVNASTQDYGTQIVNSLTQALDSLRSVTQSREAKLLLAATALRFAAGFTIGIWKAPFVFAKFAGSASAFAGTNAIIVAIGGLLSSLLGGYLSDRLTAGNNLTGRPRARAWVPAVGSALAAPTWAMFVLSDNPQWAAVFLFFEYLVAECWFGPTLAALFSAVPLSSRGTAQGLFSVLTAVGNLAPVVVGAFAGGVLGDYALSDVLLVTVSGCYALCAVLFTLAALEDDKKLQI